MIANAAAPSLSQRSAPDAPGGDPVEPVIIVHPSLEAVRERWLAFEAHAAFTPYQRFDWIAACLAAGFDADATLRIIEIMAGGRTLALIPLAIAPWMGAARGQLIGTSISNGDALIVDRERAALVTGPVITRALDAVRAQGTPLDLVLFASWAARWQGVDSPLLSLPHRLAPNTFYTIDLPGGEGGSFIDESFPHKRRTNIKRSARRLAEQFGPLTLRQAGDRAEVEAFHAAFLEQRSRRFRQMGVTNIFARDTFRRLFLDGATTGLDDSQPALRIHALFAGDTILATCIGTYANRHYSQYINSTTDGPAAKYTLMGVMMSMLVDELRTTGVTSMDMGLGDFDYKVDWTRPMDVYDTIVGVTGRGRVMARALGQARSLKRAVKTNPVAWKLARSVLALRARVTRD